MRSPAKTDDGSSPVHLIEKNKQASYSNLAAGKCRIDLEESASLDYIHDDADGQIDSLDIYLGERATLNLFLLISAGKSYSKIVVHHGQGSSSNIFFCMTDGMGTEVECNLDGAYSRSEIKGVFLARDNMDFKITTNSYHNAIETKGDIIVQGVLTGDSEAVFRGMIRIDKIAQKTNSFLSNHNLLLSKGATCNSIPSLEIDANDVKASHGATIGKPDEEMIFYMMAHGIPRNESEKLLVKAHFSKVLDALPEDKRMLFDDRISKVEI
jgi:Fe-S cluster assembly scaffold protein SufB